MASDYLRVLSFDTGIEKILRESLDTPQALPDRVQFRPVGQQIPARLEGLLQAQTLERLVQDFVAPDVRDPEILTPARYEGLIQDCQQSLLSRAESGDADSAVLTKAADLLGDEQQLRALLSAYRNTLIQA